MGTHALPSTYPARAHEVEVTNRPASSSVTGLNKPHCAAGPAAIKANPVATQRNATASSNSASIRSNSVACSAMISGEVAGAGNPRRRRP